MNQKKPVPILTLSLLALILIALFVVAACGVQSSATYTKKGILRDTIWSVEERGNGTVVLWLTHSESTGLCFPDPKQASEVESMIDAQNDEVIVRYEGQPSSADPNGRCKYTESSRSETENTYTIYVATNIKLAPVKGNQ